MQKQNKQVINAAFAQYRPLWKRGISVDLIGRRDSYEGYDLLIAPMMYLCEEKTAERLARFVADGGTLVGTYAMAEANENDLCHLGGWPCGVLKEVFGLRAEELDTLYPEETVPLEISGERMLAKDYCEILKLQPDTKILGIYKGEFYQNTPCLTEHAYGKGKAYYIAFRDKDGAFSDRFYGKLADALALPRAIPGKDLPDGVSAEVREADGEHYLFLLNFSRGDRTVKLDGVYSDPDGQEVSGSIDLPPYGAAVLKKEI